jgi:cob(I)alamin adenosyltransferase
MGMGIGAPATPTASAPPVRTRDEEIQALESQIEELKAKLEELKK